MDEGGHLEGKAKENYWGEELDCMHRNSVLFTSVAF